MTWARTSELAFVLVLPLACIVVAFRHSGTHRVDFAAETAIAMAAYGVSKLPCERRVYSFLLGLLFSGSAHSLNVAFMLLPIPLEGQFGFALLACLPLGTAWWLLDRIKVMGKNRLSLRWAVSGVLAAFIVPLALQVLVNFLTLPADFAN
jgi:hypothetical protein